MYALQRNLMYFPHKEIGAPAAYGLTDVKNVALKSRDGLPLQAWTLAARPGAPTLVYFHGNAGNLSHRVEKFEALMHAGFGFVAVSYRGYGQSAGMPDEEGIYNDARAAMDYVRDVLKIKPVNTVLYGESLGSGVAVQMATEFPVAAVALEAPYLSVAQRAQEMYPVLPARLILKDGFYSIDKVAQVKAPLIVFHGEEDRVIPARHGRALLAAANEPKEGVFYPGVGHTDFNMKDVAQKLKAFLGRAGTV